MKGGDIAVLFSFNTIKTKKTADRIIELLGNRAVPMNVENMKASEVSKFKFLILGVPTWNDGELPNYWDEFLPDFEDLDLSGKKVAIYGGGDEVMSSENFVDAIGILADVVTECGAEVVGAVSGEGFTFDSSRAFRSGKFIGLPIDYQNKGGEVDAMIKAWVKTLETYFPA